MISGHVFADVDGLLHEGVQLEGLEFDPVQGLVPV